MVKKLGTMETRILESMMQLKDKYGIVRATNKQILKNAGYNEKGGGSMTNTLNLLELKGRIYKVDKNKFKVII